MNHNYKNKSLGQYWLNDQSTLQAICESANVSEQDVVLEIGPGLGSLTEVLIESAKKVIAVELDNSLVRALENRLSSKNLSIFESDILKFDLTKLPKDYKVIANIPYYLTSNLLRVLCESTNPFSRAALLIQKEVAERVVAKPGSMSILSVSVQFYCSANLGIEVPAKMFNPPPKVDSQLLLLTRREQPLFPSVNTKEFFRIVKAGFSQRRKNLLNSLSAGLRKDKELIKKLLDEANITQTRRAQTLSMGEWYELYRLLNP